MKLFYKKYPIITQKILYSFIILLVYLVGRDLPLYGVDMSMYVNTTDTVESLLTQTVSGGRNFTTLFSLGISPYMMSMMLVQIVAALRSEDAKKRTSPKTMSIITIIVTFFFAIGEAWYRTGSLEYRPDMTNVFAARILCVIEMVTGVMIIMSLCNKNKKYGVGGQTVIIIVNILDSIMRTLATHEFNELIVPVSILLVICFFTIVLENAEFRIPVHRISIHNIYYDKNYIAYKLNPIGAMPIMFATVLFLVPQFTALALLLLFPENETLVYIQENLTLGKTLGVIVYIGIIFFLTISLSLIFLSPKDMAENLQKGGDTILSLRAGKQTRKYLTNRLLAIATGSATFMSVCVGIPMFMQIRGDLDATLTMLPATAMALTSISNNLMREMKSVRDFDAYTPFL